MHAAGSGHEKIMKMLLGAGADVQAIDNVSYGSVER